HHQYGGKCISPFLSLSSAVPVPYAMYKLTDTMEEVFQTYPSSFAEYAFPILF
ncbi:hypothetical protein AVEN_29862-1, partial [Araneus ventricosus]